MLDVDTTRLLNTLVILIVGIIASRLISIVFIRILRRVRWDEKLAARLKGKDAVWVDKTIQRILFWLFILITTLIAAGEVSGIGVIINIAATVNAFLTGLQSNLLIMFAIRLVIAFILSLLFLFVWRKIKVGGQWLATRVDIFRQKRLKTLKFQDLEVLSHDRISRLIHSIIKYLSWVVYLLLIIVYIVLLSSLFPSAWQLMATLLTPLGASIGKMFLSFVAWIPSFISLILIIIAGFYLIKLAGYLFNEIGKGTIRFKGFYPEWAKPTYQLVRVFIIALTLVFAFPFIPGSSSPAFQGVSVFLGLLISLGSTSVIANIMAGIVLTYSRAFTIGDRVQINTTIGDVTERSLLATTVRTIKNEDITIPNNLVLGAHIINYSHEAKKTGLILYTSVTIGYDTPWRDVHNALIAAALATPDILETPGPFVLQTALNDFFVSYQINAYTNNAVQMAVIYSDLHQNIQDKFNEAGLEILSPHYTQLRDGNKKAVPDEYLPKRYKKPGFKFEKD
jgi:small-conductance mechanosensitive channel